MFFKDASEKISQSRTNAALLLAAPGKNTLNTVQLIVGFKHVGMLLPTTRRENRLEMATKNICETDKYQTSGLTEHELNIRQQEKNLFNLETQPREKLCED